jgi:hypothetical protein
LERGRDSFIGRVSIKGIFLHVFPGESVQSLGVTSTCDE